jgi:hypothetical protein
MKSTKDFRDKTLTTTLISSASTYSYVNHITNSNNTIALPGSKIYTFSLYFFNTTNADVAVGVWFRDSNGTNLNSVTIGNYISAGAEGISSVTIDATALNDVSYPYVRFYFSKQIKDITSELSYQYEKLEVSPIYTYWTPGE